MKKQYILVLVAFFNMVISSLENQKEN